MGWWGSCDRAEIREKKVTSIIASTEVEPPKSGCGDGVKIELRLVLVKLAAKLSFPALSHFTQNARAITS